jgi:hypothetical protein
VHSARMPDESLYSPLKESLVKNQLEKDKNLIKPITPLERLGVLRPIALRTMRGVVIVAGVHVLSLGIRFAIADSLIPDRARYAAEGGDSLRFTPVNLTDGSRLTLISPRHWSDIADEVTQELTRTHRELTGMFGSIPPFRSSIRLMDEQSFYDLTGAPGWTNAMFFRGEIIIPLAKHQPIDLENIHRSVKHEYTHAVLSALSRGRIPGWIDEGLAQWIEGDENPALRATLKNYLQKSEPVALHLLQGGFTKLESRMVPAAYAQSLLAMQAVVQTYGLTKITAYLQLLREDYDRGLAFETAFQITQEEFERRLKTTLKTWAKTTSVRNTALELTNLVR